MPTLAPLARGAQHNAPLCDYYAATFERLFVMLVHPRACVVETACEAQGAAACVFELAWPAATGADRAG